MNLPARTLQRRLTDVGITFQELIEETRRELSYSVNDLQVKVKEITNWRAKLAENQKNAIIGAGSKVPHLSYVGDAEIGANSNIGAGTIFANYDGVKKQRSVIGSEVRTGSHNVFVAPITIGDGAYTAAGTVVRRNINPGDLGMNVAPQKNIADWVLSKREGTSAAKAAQAARDAETK